MKGSPRGRRVALGAPAAAAALVLGGCGGNQNALEPESPQARHIATLWWVMLGGAAFGFGVVVSLLLLGWVRRNREHLPFGGGDRVATGLIVGLGIAVPVVVLSLLFVWADVFVLKSTAAPKKGSTRLTIRVIGHQWFWEVRYPGTRAVSANEIHIPVGDRVRVVGTTDDVIHSFWVPALNRKIDLIPDHRNVELLQADRAGVYRGQCAEFCGLQHANMALYVVAEPRARFEAWFRNMAGPARVAPGGAGGLGRRLFLAEACSGCHTIRGTAAAGKVGPDLTHLRTRLTLGALTIPNTRAYLRAWIRDPQHFKPGNRMPALGLSDFDLDAVVAYLETLT